MKTSGPAPGAPSPCAGVRVSRLPTSRRASPVSSPFMAESILRAPRQLVIAYRSRTGPARWCAEEAGRSAAELGHPARVVPLPRARHLPTADEAVVVIARAAEAADAGFVALFGRIMAGAARDLRRVDCRLLMLADSVPAHAPLLRLLSP